MYEARRTLASIIRFKWYADKSTFLVASYRAKATGCFGGVPYKVKVSDIFRSISSQLPFRWTSRRPPRTASSFVRSRAA